MLIKLLFSIAFLLLAIAAALFYIHFGGSGNLLVVRFDSLQGINAIGSVRDVWDVLALGLLLNIINVLLTRSLVRRALPVANLLPPATVLVDLLILIYISSIIVIN